MKLFRVNGTACGLIYLLVWLQMLPMPHTMLTNHPHKMIQRNWVNYCFRFDSCQQKKLHNSYFSSFGLPRNFVSSLHGENKEREAISFEKFFSHSTNSSFVLVRDIHAKSHCAQHFGRDNKVVFCVKISYIFSQNKYAFIKSNRISFRVSY